MEGNNPDEIPVEYADVYSDKEGSSTDDDKDSNNDLSNEMNTNDYENISKHETVEVTIRSATDGNPRQPKRKVPSMYDEDMYALPNENEEGSNTTAPNDKNLHSKQQSIEKENKKGACCNIRCYFLVFGFLLIAAGVGVPIYFTTNKSGNNIQYYISSNQYNFFTRYGKL